MAIQVSSCTELIDLIVAAVNEEHGQSVTWLNHVSVQATLNEPYVFNIGTVGIDGKLLQRALGASERTSADLVLPEVLRELPRGTRIAAVGGHPQQSSERSQALRGLCRMGVEVAYVSDGYAGLGSIETLAGHCRTEGVKMVIIGLGAGKQEEYAAGLAEHGLVAVTCGGWLDQILHPGYYPPWAYPLRLNWLVRLFREPRRLWRRYTVDALKFLCLRRRYVHLLGEVPGLRRAPH